MTIGPGKDTLMVLLNTLKQRHRDLDVAIDSLVATASADQLQLRRLKKGVHIVVGTPGRIIDHLNRKTLK